jgi:hypothetical protein
VRVPATVTPALRLDAPSPWRRGAPDHRGVDEGKMASVALFGTQSADLRSPAGWEGRSRSMSPESPDEQRDAQHWRRLEAEARLIALTMADPERKRVMLFIAAGYELLAQRAELRDIGPK